MILPLIVGIVIGYFLSGQTNQKPKLSENNADEIALDLQDYVRLQNLEDKYKKADEILGKVMLLYLANIAARLDEPSTAYFSKPHEERTHLPEKVRDDSEEKEIAKVERPEVVAREKVSNMPESISEDLVFGPGDFKKEIKILNEFASDKLLTFGKNNITLSETGKHFSNLVGSIFDGYIKTPRFNEKIKSNNSFVC